jgi:S1-C subfamily serine protease
MMEDTMSGAKVMGGGWIASTGGMAVLAFLLLWQVGSPVTPIRLEAPVLPAYPAAVDSRVGLRLAETKPVTVQQVQSGSPADKAGILPGDVLMVVEDQCITGAYQATAILGRADTGATLQVELLRSGRFLVVAVKLPA